MRLSVDNINKKKTTTSVLEKLLFWFIALEGKNAYERG